MKTETQSKVPAPVYADPFQAFRAEMDRLAEGFFGGTRWMGPFQAYPAARNGDGIVLPSIDVKEDEATLVLTAELPGMDEEDVQLSVEDGVLTLKGEKKHAYEETKDRMHVMERRYGSVQRSFRLPETVDEAAIAARFDNGVLTVTMKKRPHAAPKAHKIAIAH